MSAPKCPTELQIKEQLEYLKHQITQGGEPDEVFTLNGIVNSLYYLENALSNRRAYQKKNQIKRRVILQYAKEHGFDREINEAVELQHGDVMNADSLDDLQDGPDE